MPSHIQLNQGNDIASVVALLKDVQKTASRQQTGNSGTAFTPTDDEWEYEEDGSVYGSDVRTGIVTGSAASTFGGIARRTPDGELEPLVDTEAITAEVDSAKEAAQNAVDDAANAVTAVASVADIANAANANAGTALTNANQALARATHITTGTTAPTENVKTGDVWYPTNTDGNVTGMKTWGGSAWTDVQLMAGSILVPGSVGATQIADGTITTPKLNVTEDMAVKLLQAHKIEAGEIDLNTLNGQVITGATLKTAADGSRIEIFNKTAQVENGTNSGAIRFYNSSGEWVGEFNVDDEGLLNIMTGHLNEQGEPDPMYFANITNVMGSLMLTSKQGVSLVVGGGQWDFRGDGNLHSNQSIYINNNEVASQSGWVNLGYGSGYKKQTFGHVPRIMRMGDVVFAQGTALKNSGNIAADDHPFGTIPVGYRPDATQYATVTCAGNHMANIQINTNGTINVKGAPTGGTPWLTLDSCVWQTADTFPTS